MAALKLALGVGALGIFGVAFTVYEIFKGFRAQTNNLGQQIQGSAPNTPPKCVVCLKGFRNFDMGFVSLPCTHRVHVECAKLLLEQNETSCPMCRKRI